MTISIIRADAFNEAKALTVMAEAQLPYDPFPAQNWIEEEIISWWIMKDDVRVGVLAAELDARVAPKYEMESISEPGSMYLILIAVKEDYRRQGIARAAMRQFITESFDGGRRTIHSNVRRSNIASIQLHRTMGFDEAGVHVDYYPDPLEDTLKFSLSAPS